MALRATVLLAVWTMAAAQSAPRTGEMVSRVSAYVQAYERDFAFLVADEFSRQTVRERDTVTLTRQTRGELFATFLDDDRTWMSVHDVTEVDGRPIPSGLSVRDQLMTEPLRVVAARVAAANARYNIGRVTRNFNEPTLALVVFEPRWRDDVRFTRDRVTTSPAGVVVTLRFEDRRRDVLVRSQAGPVRMQGSAEVDAETGTVQHTTITFDDGSVSADLETIYAHDANVNRAVPVRFTETYRHHRTGESTRVDTTLSNYRRFETSGHVVP